MYYLRSFGLPFHETLGLFHRCHHIYQHVSFSSNPFEGVSLEVSLSSRNDIAARCCHLVTVSLTTTVPLCPLERHSGDPPPIFSHRVPTIRIASSLLSEHAKSHCSLFTRVALFFSFPYLHGGRYPQ